MARTRHKWDPVCAPPRGLVRPVPIDPTGVHGPTRGEANGPGWRRTTRGLFVPADVDPAVPEQRILEQSLRIAAWPGAVTGWAGCRLHGANFFDGLGTDGRARIPVPLAIGPLGQVRKGPEVNLSRERLVESEIVTRHGIPCTRPLRALFDEMRYAAGVRASVVAMDMMAAAGLVSIRQMHDYLLLHPGWTGVPRAREALGLAHERSKSPNEVQMRLIWVIDAGLPRPLVNQPVFDLNGRLLGIPDLLDPVAGVVGEYDGAEHRWAARHSKDVAREERFRAHGLEYFKVTGPDLADRALVVDRMHSTRSRAKWRPPGRRTWTLEEPGDWEPEWTLDQLLEHQVLMGAIHEQLDREGSGIADIG